MDKNKTLLNLKTSVIMSISSIIYIKFIRMIIHKTKPIDAFIIPQIDSIVPLLNMDNSPFIKNLNESFMEYISSVPFDFDKAVIEEIKSNENMIKYLVPDLASIIVETLVSKINWNKANFAQNPYLRMDIQHLESRHYIKLIRYQFMMNLILLCNDGLYKEKVDNIDIIDYRDIITVKNSMSIAPVHIRIEDINNFKLKELSKIIGIKIREDGSLVSIKSNNIIVIRNESENDDFIKYIF